MRVVGIGGEPAVGKTAVMHRVMGRIGPGWSEQKRGPLVWMALGDVIVLGRYQFGKFDGTDRLSMAVQPAAVDAIGAWAQTSKLSVLFEGDRLFNGSFLDAIGPRVDVELHAIVLTAPADEIAERHRAREDSQSEMFIKGRRTKYARLAEREHVTTMVNAEPEDIERIAWHVLSLIGRTGITDLIGGT